MLRISQIDAISKYGIFIKNSILIISSISLALNIVKHKKITDAFW